MRHVIFEDEKGYLHRSLIRDDDPDDMAPMGLIEDPPLLDELDWDEIKKQIHNGLVERGLFTRADVRKAQNGVTSVVTAAIRRNLILMFRIKEQERLETNANSGGEQ